MTTHANHHNNENTDAGLNGGDLFGDSEWMHTLRTMLDPEKTVKVKKAPSVNKTMQDENKAMQDALVWVYALACGETDNREEIKEIIRKARPDIAWW